jgi:Tol biopolymer transport system component
MRKAAIIVCSGTVLFLGVAGCESDRGPVGPENKRPYAPATVAADRFSDWSAPVSLGPVVNSAATENTPAISADGLSLYFGSTRAGGAGSADLWVSHRESAASDWEAPRNLGATVNSPDIDAGAALSRDGHWLYFTSNRAGGSGSNDNWVSYRTDVHDDLAWEEPVNLGSVTNTAEYEGGVGLWGPEFYFNRGSVPNAPVAGPPADIYVSLSAGNDFGPPVPVTELNSDGIDQRPSIRIDGREIIFSSDRSGGTGSSDLWTSTRSGPGRPWEQPTNLGSTINSTGQELHASISRDGTELFFASNRTGNMELYVSRRTLSIQPE